MIGADTDKLRELALRFEELSGSVAEAAAMTSRSVHDVRWQGPDADRFRSDYRARAATRLSDLGALLQDDAERLRGQADDQDRCSRAWSASNGSVSTAAASAASADMLVAFAAPTGVPELDGAGWAALGALVGAVVGAAAAGAGTGAMAGAAGGTVALPGAGTVGGAAAGAVVGAIVGLAAYGASQAVPAIVEAVESGDEGDSTPASQPPPATDSRGGTEAPSEVTGISAHGQAQI